MLMIKQLNENELNKFVEIADNAFPELNVTKWLIDDVKVSPKEYIYGLFRNEKLNGGMRFFDFKMNFLSTTVKAGGLGLLAVDLLHKKEKVAKELVTYFLEECTRNGASLAMLYPFRVDFYRKMGFGYGTQIKQFRLKPENIRYKGQKDDLVFLTSNEKQEVLDCYNRFFQHHHGLLKRDQTKRQLDRPFKFGKVVGCKKGGLLRGYLVFSLKNSEMVLHEFVYETSEALMELCSFLHSQSDQVSQVIFDTQNESLYYLFDEPANGADTGVMYRVTDVAQLFRELRGHNFGHQTCKLKITIEDDFLPSNDGSTVVYFEGGFASVRELDEDVDTTLSLHVSDFSSLLSGAVDFKTLYRFGLAKLSDEKYVQTVHEIFKTEDKPMCTTAF